MSGPAGVTVQAVEKRYPSAESKAIDGVDLEVKPGSFFSILGPSGCGKTTLLRMLAGFERPTSGRIVIGGRDVTDVPPRARDIAMVFQDYALYPHMTVRQNITFNLVNRRVAAAEVESRLRETAEMLGLSAHLAKYPAQLSGGERQRVALGRALVRKPEVFLMDEPLSNLDLKLREAMRVELGRLHQSLGITIVFVTHDQAEAMTLSSEIAIMDKGRLQQVAPPETVYAAPANTFVARFIGSPSMNLFKAQAQADGLRLSGTATAFGCPPNLSLAPGQPIVIGARAHELAFYAEAGTARLPVKISFTERMGRSNFVVCVPEDGTGCLAEGDVVQVETEPDIRLLPGSRAFVGLRTESMKLFDGAGRMMRRAA